MDALAPSFLALYTETIQICEFRRPGQVVPNLDSARDEIKMRWMPTRLLVVWGWGLGRLETRIILIDPGLTDVVPSGKRNFSCYCAMRQRTHAERVSSSPARWALTLDCGCFFSRQWHWWSSFEVVWSVSVQAKGNQRSKKTATDIAKQLHLVREILAEYEKEWNIMKEF